jgi:hypothetical protein
MWKKVFFLDLEGTKWDFKSTQGNGKSIQTSFMG